MAPSPVTSPPQGPSFIAGVTAYLPILSTTVDVFLLYTPWRQSMMKRSGQCTMSQCHIAIPRQPAQILHEYCLVTVVTPFRIQNGNDCSGVHDC